MSFELDVGVKKSLEVGRILSDLAREREELAAQKQSLELSQDSIQEAKEESGEKATPE